MRRTIAVDVDEVCANLLSEWLRRYNEDYVDSLLPEDVTDWDLSRFVKVPSERLYAYLQHPTLYAHVHPIEGARGAVCEMRSMGNRVVFVTACQPNTSHQKYDWLHRWGFFKGDDSPEQNFAPVVDKSLIRADYLFDDAPKNVLTFPGHAVLVERAHNRKVSFPYRIPALSAAPAYIATRELDPEGRIPQGGR